MVGYGSFELVVDTLARQSYIAGESFTAADVYVGSQIGYGLQFKTLPDRAEFVQYFDRIKNRPARVRATAMDDALVKPAQ